MMIKATDHFKITVKPAKINKIPLLEYIGGGAKRPGGVKRPGQ